MKDTKKKKKKNNRELETLQNNYFQNSEIEGKCVTNCVLIIQGLLMNVQNLPFCTFSKISSPFKDQLRN